MTDTPSGADPPLRDSLPLTVTLFGNHDAIDRAISDELQRRGCRTHSISVETGWLTSTTNAIVRVDTAAGASALRGLMLLHGSGVRVVAVCEDVVGIREPDRLRRLCEECGSMHEVRLLSHPPIPPSEMPELDATDPPIRHLALAVVDEVAQQSHRAAAPSFSARAVAV